MTLDRAVQAQTKEQVDKEFSEFMEVFENGENSALVIIKKAKRELDIFKIAKLYGKMERGRWSEDWDHTHIKCPFHSDNNPSCSLWKDIGAFKCWSCGAKGDVVEFIRRMQQEDKVPITFLKALLKKQQLLRKH